MVDRVIELREFAAESLKQGKGILANAENQNRAITKKEQAKIDEHIELAHRWKAQADTLEKLEEPQPPFLGGSHFTDRDMFGRSAKNLQAYTGKDGAQRAYDMSQWLNSLCGNTRSQRYVDDHNILAAGGENVGTAGGFLVPEEMSRTIIDLKEKYGVIRANARVLRMGSDSVTIPIRSNHVTSYFINENSAVTESEPSWDQCTLTARKQAVLSRWSAELDEDALISMSDWLAQDLAWAFAETEDDCSLNGDGSSTYGGIYGIRPKIIDGNHTAGAIDAASGIDLFSEVTATDIATMMAALPGYALPNAKFYVSQPGFSLVFERLAVAAGGNTMTNLAAGMQPSYMGYPVVISQKMPTSTGDLSNVAMLLFGDLNQAAILGSRSQVRILVSRERYMDSDQVGILGTSRFDFVAHSLGDGTTAGPIVALVSE